MKLRHLLPIAAAAFLASCSSSNNSTTSEAECGVERWHVKILSDSAVSTIDWTPLATTIAEQNAFPILSISEDTDRMAFEEQAVTITGTITAFKKEDDSDLHLIVIDDSGNSIIAEIPGTGCTEVAASPYAPDFSAAAAWVEQNLGKPSSDFKNVSKKVTITGILFQDFNHGQDGHAKNYREIHPVTKIQ